jgi:hypothetical protein
MSLTIKTTASRTLGGTHSFYVPSTEPEFITSCALVADAVVVHGPKGPRVIEALRREGFTGAVVFDRGSYERATKPIDAGSWFAAQAGAGADRLLTQGHWVEWDETGDALRIGIEAARAEADGTAGVTLLLAIDSRWVTTTTGLYLTMAVLAQVPEHVALVLSHRDDPLGAQTAVTNLQALITNVANLSFLRSDHGAIGAVALGAAHGSTGLMPRYRHFVPPTVTGGGRTEDRTARVFVWHLMDWFTGFTIAGWGAIGFDLRCDFDCCRGQSLARFFNELLSADDHNRTVLAAVADYALGAERQDRLGEFSRLCNDALAYYGPMGKLSDVTVPKSQLKQWAQFPLPQFR